MRDIRPDIQQRIEKLTSEFEAKLATLQELMAEENARFGETEKAPGVIRERPQKKTDLKTFLISCLEHPLEKREVIEMAKNAGYFNNTDTSPGRSVSLTLVNLEDSGAVEKTRDGKYVAQKN